MVKKIFFILIAFFLFTNQGNSQETYYIKTEILTENLYPYSEIILQVKLYDGSRKMFGEMPIPEIAGDGAYTVQRLLQIPKQQEYDFGILYDVIEYRYAIFVNKPGKYEVKSIVLEGTVKGKKITVVSRPHSFNVKPIPKELENGWRSAFSLDADIRFSNPDKNIFVGEILRRSITLTAVGAKNIFFSKLGTQKIEGVKVYQGPLEEKEIVTQSNVEIEQKYNFIYIPQKVGKFEIPEISLKWFDLESDKIQEFKIPKTIFNVTADNSPSTKGIDGKNLSFTLTINHFYYVMLLLLFVLLCSLFYVKYKRMITMNYKKEIILRNLKKACDNNNPKSAIFYSLKLSDFIGIENVSNITEMVLVFNSDRLKNHAEIMNQALFKENVDWDSNGYYNELIYEIKLWKKSKETPVFQKLYPFN